jgi:hypothetical protein
MNGEEPLGQPPRGISLLLKARPIGRNRPDNKVHVLQRSRNILKDLGLMEEVLRGDGHPLGDLSPVITGGNQPETGKTHILHRPGHRPDVSGMKGARKNNGNSIEMLLHDSSR